MSTTRDEPSTTEGELSLTGFTFRQLEYFSAVAEAGSFSAAAENLYLSQSALATAVTELERSLGTVLLIRKKAQGIRLTPAGAHFLHESRDVLRRARELQLAATEQGERLRGPLTIGCFSTVAATVLPPLLSEFSTQHPDVQVSFVDGDMDELVPRLENGSIDVLVTYRIALPPGLTEEVLYETEAHVLLPAGHRLAAAESVSLRDLGDEPLILFDLPPSAEHTMELLYSHGVQPRVVHRTGNFELVRSLVARGIGYALLIQRPGIETSYEGLPLVTRPLAGAVPREHVVIVWPNDVALTRRAEAFLEFARSALPLSPIVHGASRGRDDLETPV